MSELRWNPMLGEWIATATHRQDRTFLPPPDYCPLCPTKPGGIETEIPEAEFEETIAKARGFIEAMNLGNDELRRAADARPARRSVSNAPP